LRVAELADGSQRNVGFRRYTAVARGFGEGRLTDATAAVRHWSRERVFMPDCVEKLYGRIWDEIMVHNKCPSLQ
jgi:hypothetical protein